MITSRARKHQSSLKFSWKLARKASFLIMLLVFCVFLVTRFKQDQYFPIRVVKVFGIQHADQKALQTFLVPMVTKGFFGINVDIIKERMLQQPWVAGIAVRRVWPDQILISVVEKKPIARWNNAGLLSDTGQLFNPPADTYPNNLPEFVGPDGQQITMADYYSRLNTTLAPLHFTIARLELTPSMSWTLTLNNGMKLTVGHKDILTRMDHFVKVYPKIINNKTASAIDYVDLRYSNGMAIKWRSIT